MPTVVVSIQSIRSLFDFLGSTPYDPIPATNKG